MWLLEGFKAPDHNTTARFRTGRLEPILDDLFNKFIVKLYENNELELKNLFIDGTKIEANANKYLERQSKYDLYNSISNRRNSFSKTDIDATFMHMKDDHMKNAQLKSGYI